MIRLFKVYVAPGASAAMTETLASGYLGQGPRVEGFEEQLQELLGVDRIFATCSGTAALDLAYHLCGIGPGTEVISTPVTCTATNTPLVNRGARIVWADVCERTGLINPESVAERITPRTKAIVACDWGGWPADYERLHDFGVPVIQDGAHSFMSGGPSGDYRMWSFQAIKHLTTGDGGGLMVPPWEEERTELLRWYGLDRRKSAAFRCAQDIKEAGYKYGMNDVAATIGLANLPHASWIVERHRANAQYYCERFFNHCFTPSYNPDSSWWLYTMFVDDREAFIAHMADRGIEASPVHSRNDTKECFKAFSGALPGVEHFTERNVCVPVGWWLTDDEREQVVEAVLEWTKR